MQKSNQKVYVEALGCTAGRLDANIYRRYFQANGYDLVEVVEDADIVLFSTCGVVERWATLSIARFLELKEAAKPSARLIVGGCLPGIDPERIDEIFQGVTFAPYEDHILEEVCPGEVPLEEISCTTLPGDAPKLGRVPQRAQTVLNALAARRIPVPSHLHRCFGESENPSMCYVRISYGCLGECPFCATRHARGRLRSRKLSHIKKDFEDGLEAGHKRFVLVGEDTGCYGHDIGSSLPALLKELISIGGPGDFRFIVRGMSPRWLLQHLDPLLEVVRSGYISAIQIPIQSGCNRTLERMNRRHTIEEAEAALRRIREASPEIVLKTLVLIGFPGETAAEFSQTLALLRRGHFNEVVPMAFSARPNTDALKMNEKISPSLIAYRTARTTFTILHHVYLNRFRWFPLEVRVL